MPSTLVVPQKKAICHGANPTAQQAVLNTVRSIFPAWSEQACNPRTYYPACRNRCPSFFFPIPPLLFLFSLSSLPPSSSLLSQTQGQHHLSLPHTRAAPVTTSPAIDNPVPLATRRRSPPKPDFTPLTCVSPFSVGPRRKNGSKLGGNLWQ